METFSRTVRPDADALLANLRRAGTPRRVHFMELGIDPEVRDAVCGRFDLLAGLRRDDPFFGEKREIACQRFLGYDYVCAALGLKRGFAFDIAADTAADMPKAKGRAFQSAHRGPIMSWADFEKHPWPDPAAASGRSLTWFNENLPDGMCLIGNCGASFCEFLTWSMGYETLCYALFEQRDLVRAIADKLLEIAAGTMQRLLALDRVKAIWASDDMGFKTSTLLSPADLRQFVLPSHKAMARMAHAAGRPYLLHCCGNIRAILGDLLDDVRIDAKHSFEDTIERVTDAKAEYGDRVALLGGIDVDFLCRSDASAIRRRVRATLDACMDGGGYCLGTGNTVANYIPLDNYLVMLDEGRRYGSA